MNFKLIHFFVPCHSLSCSVLAAMCAGVSLRCDLYNPEEKKNGCRCGSAVKIGKPKITLYLSAPIDYTVSRDAILV